MYLYMYAELNTDQPPHCHLRSPFIHVNLKTKESVCPIIRTPSSEHRLIISGSNLVWIGSAEGRNMV